MEHSFNSTSDMKRSPQIMQQKVFVKVMTSSTMAEGALIVVPVYSFMNEKINIFRDDCERTKISLLNFVYICIMSLCIYLYKSMWNPLFMTSSDPKICQCLNCHNSVNISDRASTSSSKYPKSSWLYV